MNSSAKNLRFSVLKRVSTEMQARRGESLNVQHIQITEAINKLGGILQDDCIYSGQEHSTPGYERKILDKLLADAQLNKFDCVMVADVSRWGRDTRKYKEVLDVLRKNNIRYFSLEKEYNLNSPDDCFFLGVYGEMHEYVAKQISEKSLASRIERAKKGFPSFGRKPFGYTFTAGPEENAIWSVEPECKDFEKRACALYLSTDYGFDKVAEIMRNDPSFENVKKLSSFKQLDGTTLAKLLMRGDNTIHKIIFKKSHKDPIIIKLPESLLSPEDVAAIKEKASHNRARTGKSYVGVYPLSGYIRCPTCGYFLTGARTGKYKYYRHNDKRLPTCLPHIKADYIEEIVFYELAVFLNEPELIHRSIESALKVNSSEIKEFEQKRDNLQSIINKKQNERKNYIDYIAEEISRDSWETITQKINEIEQAVRNYERDIKELTSKLATVNQMPSGDQIKSLVDQFRRLTSRVKIQTLTPMQKKELVEVLIGGRTVQDRKRKNIGIFIYQKQDTYYGQKYIVIEIKGVVTGNITASDCNVVSIGDKEYNTTIPSPIVYPKLDAILHKWGLDKGVIPDRRLY